MLKKTYKKSKRFKRFKRFKKSKKRIYKQKGGSNNNTSNNNTSNNNTSNNITSNNNTSNNITSNSRCKNFDENSELIKLIKKKEKEWDNIKKLESFMKNKIRKNFFMVIQGKQAFKYCYSKILKKTDKLIKKYNEINTEFKKTFLANDPSRNFSTKAIEDFLYTKLFGYNQTYINFIKKTLINDNLLNIN